MAKSKAYISKQKIVTPKEEERSIGARLATTWGSLVAGTVLIAAGFAAGIWQESIKRETEILEITNKHSIETNQRLQTIADLKAHIRELKFKRTQNSVKIEKNGKNN